jgi:hypothetical protein
MYNFQRPCLLPSDMKYETDKRTVEIKCETVAYLVSKIYLELLEC